MMWEWDYCSLVYLLNVIGDCAAIDLCVASIGCGMLMRVGFSISLWKSYGR